MATELEPNSATTNATAISLDTIMEGSLSSTSDVDDYKVAATALPTASLVTFSFDSPLAAPLTSAYKLTVLNGSGTATSTTSNTGGDKTLIYTVAASDANKPVYFQVAANSSSEGVGETYKLKYTSQSISENTQDSVVDSNNSTSKADPLVASVPFYGKLDSSTDVDLFSFTTGSSGTVTLDFTGFSTAQSANYYTAKITAVSGAARTTVTNLSGESMSVTPSGAASASQISFTAAAQKTYFVEVGLTTDVTYDSGLASNFYAVTVGGTTKFNQEPVITMSGETSGISGTTRTSGVSKAVAKSSQTLLSELFSAADPNSGDTITQYYVKLSYSGSNNAGKLNFGGTDYAADNGSGGYRTIAASDFSAAKYVGGTSGGTQILTVWAKDSVTTATDTSGYSGLISMNLTTTDSAATAAVDGASDINITEGSTTDYAVVNLTLSAGSGSAHSSSVIVAFTPNSEVTVKDNSNGSTVLSAVTFSAGETSKSVRVYALDDSAAEGAHTGTLNFTVTSSDASYNNLLIDQMNFAVTEDLASFSNSNIAFKDSSGAQAAATILTEGNSVYGEYTVALSKTPASTVTVTVNPGDDLTANPETLTFTSSTSGSDLTKTVKLSPVDDSVNNEGRETIVVTHTVSETGVAASLLSVSNISINVDDNDSVPVVADNQSYTVSKIAASGSTFGNVSASDADGGSLVYAIVSGNSAGYFAVNSASGAIQTAADISSAVGSYNLVVSATDSTSLSDTSTVTLIVSNSEVNTAPVLANSVATVSETRSVGDVIAIVSAGDADGDTLLYSITSGNGAGKFAISSTGELSVVSALDYETTTSYSLTVSAADSALSDTGIVTVNITNENDNAPVWGLSPTTKTLSIGASIGTEIATFSATDSDSDTITYLIASGNSSALFSIGSSSGKLVTTASPSSSSSPNYWAGSSKKIVSTTFDVGQSAVTSTGSDLIIQATDLGNTISASLAILHPSADMSQDVLSNSSGKIDFANFSNGGTYNFFSNISHSSLSNQMTVSGDLQALANHLAGIDASILTNAFALKAADFDNSKVVNAADGAALGKAIMAQTGSKIYLFDSEGLQDIKVLPGSDLTLTAVVLGDLDGSYANALA